MPVAKRQTAKTTKKRSVARTKMGNILDRAEPIVFDNDEPFSMGIFGKASTGKTTLAATFPGQAIYIGCSGGLKKPGELRSIPKEDRKKLEPIYIKNCEELNEITEAVASSDEHKTVILDNLTSFSDMCLEQVTDKPVPAQMSWGYASQQQWGKHGALVKSFLRNLMNLEKYVVIISHERWFEPPEDSTIGVSVVGPACTPTVTGWLVGALDYSVQAFIRAETVEKSLKVSGKIKKTQVKTGNTEFCLYLPFCEDRMTKFRKPKGTKLEKILIDPTFEKLKEIIGDD